MPAKFHERFQIEVPSDLARQRFVNRVHNEIYNRFIFQHIAQGNRYELSREVATHMGDRFTNDGFETVAGNDFQRNLHMLEAIYAGLGAIGFRGRHQQILSGLIVEQLQRAEVDLGVRWDNGVFYPSGAALLDHRLVNDALHWLRQNKYETVVQPFEKALRHLLEVQRRPELAEDVVTDMYEALEALARIVTGRAQKDLSANQELFIGQVKASDGYKRLLKEYISYANTLRHAKEEQKPRPKISVEEAESFVYLTGVFVRLAVTAGK